MTNHPTEWDLQIIQTRFVNEYGIEITLEQASFIYEKEVFQILKQIPFSLWEGADYELSTMKEVLSSTDLKLYSAQKELIIRQNEELLSKSDYERNHQFVVLNTEINQYLSDTFLPAIFKDHALWSVLFYIEKPKIDYLKAEYKKYLEETLKEMVSSHFRFNRSFAPTELKQKFLLHRQQCLLPDYHSFKAKMDAPTIMVRDYLKVRLRDHANTIDDALKQKLQSFQTFSQFSAKKHVEEIRGWNYDIPPTAEEEKENRLMFMILIDNKKYYES